MKSSRSAKKKKNETPSGYAFDIPISCAVCSKCMARAIGGMCLYGGPFSGYKKVSD